jgi:PHD/YefM family antitoxin component YafN of YafNO toxin-antitoxin module
LNRLVCDVSLHGMTSDSIVNVTQAQARLNKLVDHDSFAISRHGKIVGIYLSRDRIEALIETMELLSNPEFGSALKDYEAGPMKFYDAAELDKAMSA